MGSYRSGQVLLQSTDGSFSYYCIILGHFTWLLDKIQSPDDMPFVGIMVFILTLISKHRD